MAITLNKTWVTDQSTTPASISTTKQSNSWMLWAIKELMLLGNNSIKGGPNSWTVVGSCDSTQFAMDGTDYWADPIDDLLSGTGNHSWIVLRQAAMGSGSGFEVCLDFTDDTSYYDEITVAVSWSAGFTGGSTSSRPTATDENELMFESIDWFGHTSVKRITLTKMMSSDGQCTRIFGTVGSVYDGCFLFETLGDASAWVNKNAFVLITSSDLTRSNMSNTGLFKGEVDGDEIIGVCSNLVYQGNSFFDFVPNTIPDLKGEKAVYNANLWSNTASRYGRLGTLYDFYNVGNATDLVTLPGSATNRDLVVFGDYAFGHDGRVLYG
jgi:hypothetical protein